jgi:hypothetical protein
MKPVFHDVAELIGGLIEADKKKKKRAYAASKYAKLDIQPLPATPPARLARARLPAFVEPDVPRRVTVDVPRRVTVDAPRRVTVDAPRRGRPAGKPKVKRRTKAEMEQARAKEEIERRAVEYGASDELREYLERPDFLEALAEDRAAKLPPKVLEIQRRVVAKRAANELPKPVETKTAEPSPKKRAAAAKIRPPVAEFSASTEPKVGLGRFLGRFA